MALLKGTTLERQRAKRIKELQRQLNEAERPRVYLGLDAACNGDPNGVAKFLSFIERELGLWAISGQPLPEPIAARIDSLKHAARDTLNFVHGFIDAKAQREKAH